MRVRPTLRITLMALLAAVSGALGLVTPTIAGSRLLKFNGFPIVLSGFLLGPVGGFWCGALADIVAFMLKPGGAYNPFFTVTSGLTGMLPVLIYQKLAPRREGKLVLDPLSLLISIGLAQVGIKVLLVSPLLAVWSGLPVKALALHAALEQAVHTPLYAYAVWVVLRRVVLRRRPESRGSALQWAEDPNRSPGTPADPGITRSGPREL